MSMNEMTAANLRSAFGGESQAHMRYKVWGARAKDEGFPNVARLFEAIAFAEEVHANNHFHELASVNGDFLVASVAGFGLNSTAENLQGAIDGENFEVQQMYPAYIAVAKEQDEKGGMRSFHYAIEAEKIHAALFTEAKQAVEGNEDLALDTVQICDICGHTRLGEAPDKCPVCGRGREVFRAFP
ncbi:MAG: rubrerythrin family protein [Desulfuromonadales bacterium]|nr:rubrerythrin family protein [Desulfuromonadales bacterium]